MVLSSFTPSLMNAFNEATFFFSVGDKRASRTSSFAFSIHNKPLLCLLCLKDRQWKVRLQRLYSQSPRHNHVASRAYVVPETTACDATGSCRLERLYESSSTRSLPPLGTAHAPSRRQSSRCIRKRSPRRRCPTSTRKKPTHQLCTISWKNRSNP